MAIAALKLFPSCPVEGSNWHARTADKWGEGSFGAPRAGRLHEGLDLVAPPGEVIIAPVCGFISRLSRPYGDDGPGDSGFIFQPAGALSGFELIFWYVEVMPYATLAVMHQGAAIGRARDLEARYPGITPHVHFAVRDAFGKPVDPSIWRSLPAGLMNQVV